MSADPFFRQFFNLPNQPMERKTQSLGSGVIVDAKRGLVLTNNHVIANAVQITVTLRDGRQLEAEIIGTDPDTDVAVIRIPAENLTEVKPANSDELRVGDFVVAIGNPFGLGQTVTSGIVSALSRSGLGIEDYEDFIQTDASINPGNSGGALVNLRGELVGINTAIISESGGNIGIGLAIPINLAMQITSQLLDKGVVERGYIGIKTQDLTPDLAEAFGLDSKMGAVVVSVLQDSPASIAGIKPGDIITSVNNKNVRNAQDVLNQIGLVPVGNKINLNIVRDGKKVSVVSVIGSSQNANPTGMVINQRLEGVTVGDIKENHAYYGRISGILVMNVLRDSIAWNSGLRSGDIVTSLNHEPITNLAQFLRMVNNYKESLLLRIVRGNTAAFLVIK
ncbi:MAG: serine endoprotease DegQ [Gammaproteobacteria bacterium RIFCSPLOWO2_02_FULL_52_10]|nr:MAG: serine endoprotease DegQ [Gammaproteobacteria bacterium RIFCSPLOWO2_02_FULL_52_10]